MAMHIFIRDEDAGETWAYCGPARSVKTHDAIRNFISMSIDSAHLEGNGDTMLSLSIEEMSDDDVASLPEM